MSDWREQYGEDAERDAKRFARFSDRELMAAIRHRKTGDYYVIWYEVAKRKATAEWCWLLYEVLLSDRPYLDRYHCAAALLALLPCKEFEEVELSAEWPVVRENLAKLRTIVESKFGPPAKIGEASGDPVRRQAEPAPPAALPATGASAQAAWVHRYAQLRSRFAGVVLVAVLIFGAAIWVKNRVLVVQPGKGTPMGSTVRSANHLATLIDQRQPYTPSLHHDPSTERFTLNLHLLPLDGSAPKLVPLMRDLHPGGYSLAHVIGTDGQTMWVNVNGLIGVKLASGELVTERDVIKANPSLDTQKLARVRGMDIVDGRLRLLADDHSTAWALNPSTLQAAVVEPRATPGRLSNPPLSLYMAAGLRTASDSWLGLHSQADLDGTYRPHRWLGPVESASDTPSERRRLVRGELGEETSDGRGGKVSRIRAMTPIGESAYRNASFLRLSEKSEPLRLNGPDSVLMLHSSGDGTGTGSTLLVSRVETASGRLLWTHDTKLHRFKLEQILPAEESTLWQ